MLKYIEVIHNPKNLPLQGAVIWLHGLGASGDDFAPCVPYLNLSDNLALKFIFPHAPHAPVTINGGYVMPSWYDILERTLERKVDTAQIERSATWIDELIDEQITKGILSDKIVIAGFSQGGAVAYHHVLGSTRPLAGLIALSTYFATKDTLTIHAPKDTPIFIGHGSYDDVVPTALGTFAYEHLSALGFNPTFRRYPMAHQASLAQLGEIGAWLNDLFGQ